MTVVLIIAIAVMAGCMATLTFKVGKIEKTAETAMKMADNTDTYIQVKNLDAYTKKSVGVANGNFDSVASAIKQQREDVDGIIGQLETIAADIARLDGEVAQVKKDEKEIRSYYINYRTPAAIPIYSAGVPWAADFKCGEETE